MGTRTFAEELADLVSEVAGLELCGFVENWEKDKCKDTLDGIPIFWFEEIKEMASSHKAVCSLATTKRSLFVDQMKELGFSFAKVIHPQSRISTTSQVGDGSIVSVGAIIAAKTRLGEHVLVNRGAIIGHHDEIGDFCNIQPGATIGGSTSIGHHTYVGMRATVLNGLKIGSRCIIGAGAVVTKDVPDNVQVMGVPAKIVKENIDGL